MEERSRSLRCGVKAIEVTGLQRRQEGQRVNGLDEKRAVIDIGSNTIRLVIFGGPPRAPTTILNEKVTARLGKAVVETGRLSERAMNGAVAALHRYSVLLEANGITHVETVATAATRDAANGADFLGRIAELGLRPRQLSGEEEAKLSAQGVIGAFPAARGTVADLGGGSLELVRIKGGQCKRGVSLPIGTLRLPALLEGGAVRFRKRLAKYLAESTWSAKPNETLYLVGGAFRAIARHLMFRARSPLDDPHGYEIGASEALLAFRRLARSTSSAPVPGVSQARLGSLPHAAALLAGMVRSLRPSRIVFSSWGLREGLMFSELPAHIRETDPLLAGVSTFTRAMGVDARQADEIADWLASFGIGTDPAQAGLLRSSIMLAIASRTVEPNLRAPTILDWALHKRWIGIDSPQRAMMAACIMADSNRILPQDVVKLAQPQAVEQATTWGLALRFCRRLTSLAPKLMAVCPMVRDGGRLVLSLHGSGAALASEAIEREFSLLAAYLGLKPEIVRT